MTTKAQISKWYDDGKDGGHMFMFVMCDTYDWEDYPKYTDTVEDAKSIKKSYPSNMQTIMEIYDLRADKQEQLNTHLNISEIK
jgi:hypothetical protein